MAAPDDSAIVRAVAAAKHYDYTTKIGSGRFLEDVVQALHKHNDKWGHLKKLGGQNQWNGHAVDNPLWFEAGRSQAVDIIAASESTNAHLSWAPDQPRAIYDERWYPPTGPDGFRLPPHHTRLGASLFWLMAGFRGYRQQLEANLEWIRDELRADYIRAFAVVGGDEYQTGSGGRADPWQYAGSFLSWPDYDQVFAGAHDLAASYGLKVAWTLVGGDAQVPSIGQRGAPVQVSTVESQVGLCDRIANLLLQNNRLASTELLECWNEYTITGGTREGLRAMAARLRQRLGSGVLIALDTPETAMSSAGEADKLPGDTTYLYGGSAATCITPQWARDEPNPRHMGPDAPAAWYSHEPRGPGASAGGDTADPLYLADDYMQSCMVIANGPPQPARGYLFHTKAGVWGGHCNPAWPAENAHANVFDHDPSGAIASALSTVRAGGTVSPGDPSHPIDPGEPDVPIPPYDEPWITNTVRPAVIAKYDAHNHPLDDMYPIWITRTQYDHDAGMSQQASLDKHLAELEKALSGG